MFRGGDAALRALMFDPFYQLVRLSLLAHRIAERRELGADDARVVLVRPRENEALRRRITSPILARTTDVRPSIEKAFRQFLLEPSHFRWASPAELVSAVRASGAASPGWARYLDERYGWV